MSKKLLKLSILFVIINLILITPVFGEVLLYQNKTSDVLSKGVIRENIRRFTDNGWLNINVIKVDLTNRYINLDTIFSKKGISNRTDVLQMAEDSGAIAAINADFFSPKPNTNLAHSIGPVVKNGELVTTPANDENMNTYGVFSLTNTNQALFNYWKKNITVSAPNGQAMQISDVNKFGWYTFLYMYDSNWGNKTIGKTDVFPTLTEMVVVNNRVKSFSTASNPIDIPQNGYVLCGDYEAGKFLKDNFKIGDLVDLETVTTPDLSSIKTAVGGGAILVKDGVIPTFSHNISGLNPRTALGISKDGKQAILVTVDGRQRVSKGMTQLEMSNLLIELGAYNAINFDGGGSTTMVTRNIYNSQLEVVNSLSEPSQRPVTNGIGVFSDYPVSNLSRIKITSSSSNIFKNTSIQLWVSGYDMYSNPKEVLLNNVKWSVSGVTGTFEGNTFRPTSSGKAKITATIDNKTNITYLNVLDYPTELILSNNKFQASQETITFSVTGKDKNGYSAPIALKDLTISNKAVTVKDNSLQIPNNFSGLIKLSFKNVYSYIGISLQNTTLENFEKSAHSFWGYPTTVKGNLSISNEQHKDGNSSGKLDFDFSGTDGTKGAYIKFAQDGLKISSKPKNLSVWTYSDKQYSHGIKGELIDSNNKVFRITFTSEISWTGWKNLSATLPIDISYPVYIRKLYVVGTDTTIKDSGTIYFDLLQSVYGSNTALRIPASKKLSDSHLSILTTPPTDSYSIAVYGNTNKLTKLLQDSFINKINTSSNFAALINTTRSDITKPNIINNNRFSTKEYANTLFISISASGTSNSIRIKDSTQWTSLFNALNNNNKQNAIILLDTPIWGTNGFSDILEASLLKQTLSDYVTKKGKTVWVIYSSPTQTITNEDGVKYIGISSRISTKYLNITVTPTDMTYKFNRIN